MAWSAWDHFFIRAQSNSLCVPSALITTDSKELLYCIINSFFTLRAYARGEGISFVYRLSVCHGHKNHQIVICRHLSDS